jgi:muconate cycloisomerase
MVIESMRLNTITLYHYKRPFEVSFQSSHATRSRADSVIVALKFSNGVTGYGESAPRDYVTGETIPSVYQSIRNDMAPVLFQSPIEDLADIARILTRIESGIENGGAKPVKHHLSALGSIDLALLDALGKHAGCHAGQFGAKPRRAQAPLSITVPLITPQDIQKKWHQLQRWLPIKSFKVVVSDSVAANLKRSALIRDVIGPAADMRIEANGQWTYAEACQNLRAMQALNVSGVEEPLLAAERDKLHQLRSDFGIPVTLDESICTWKDAQSAIQARGCDIINIKVSKCGGFIRSQKIMRMAVEADRACQIGTHVGESAILDAAGWHLALAAENLTYFEGCSFLLHNTSLAIGGTPPSRQVIDDRPGWGLSQEDIERLLDACEILGQIDTAKP